MNIKGETKIYRNKEGRYSRRVATQGYENGQKTGEWVSKFIDLQMPKDTDLPSGTTIEIINGFEKARKWTSRDGIEHIELCNVITEFRVVSGDLGANSTTSVEGMEEIGDDLPW